LIPGELSRKKLHNNLTLSKNSPALTIVAELVIIGLICLAGYLAGKKQAENEIRAGKWD